VFCQPDSHAKARQPCKGKKSSQERLKEHGLKITKREKPGANTRLKGLKEQCTPVHASRHWTAISMTGMSPYSIACQKLVQTAATAAALLCKGVLGA
jgi:hypothetical protein